MINLDLVQGVPIAIYTCNKRVPVSRIGEIVIPVVSGEEQKFEVRPPWSEFGVANDWSYRYGIYRWASWNGSDYLEAFILDPKFDKIKSLADHSESIDMALLQMNENNGLQVALCSSVSLRGAKISSDNDEAQLIFEIQSCEMIYNR